MQTAPFLFFFKKVKNHPLFPFRPLWTVTCFTLQFFTKILTKVVRCGNI